MFCSNCGFEYSQKTNYCKRCGAVISVSEKAPGSQFASLKITSVFFVIAAFVMFSLMYVYDFYEDMIRNGIRGDDLIIPFMLGIGLIGVVAILLSWQLSRMITAIRNQPDWSTKPQERISFTEVQPQGRYITPVDAVRNAIENPSIVEHTTRQMARTYQNPPAQE